MCQHYTASTGAEKENFVHESLCCGQSDSAANGDGAILRDLDFISLRQFEITSNISAQQKLRNIRHTSHTVRI